MVIGIDIGGTEIKIGVVTSSGEIMDFLKLNTVTTTDKGFFKVLIDTINLIEEKHPNIIGVGIGIPGTLSRDRKTAIDVPAIKELNGVNIYEKIKHAFPRLLIHIENDANTAGLGEFNFGSHEHENGFLFVTLGTGIGSCAVISENLFTGANGNGMEIGHLPSLQNKKLEQNIGRIPFMKYARSKYKQQSKDEILWKIDSPKKLYERAENGDKIAISIFDYMGILLGEAIVSTIRIIDVESIVLGGGLSGAIKYIAPSILKSFDKYLPEYYISNLTIRKATKGNDAGLIGAASMIYKTQNKIEQLIK